MKGFGWLVTGVLLVVAALYLHAHAYAAMEYGLHYCLTHKWFDEANAIACDNQYYSSYNNSQIVMWITGVIGGLIVAAVILGNMGYKRRPPVNLPQLSDDK